MSDCNINGPGSHDSSCVTGGQNGDGSSPESSATSEGGAGALSPGAITLDRFNLSGITKPSPSGSSTSYFCRICHEGDSKETLVAPCKCSGTVALIHTSCLEHWLTASNTDRCEICKQSFKVEKVPRPCLEYFQDPTNQFNVRNLIADVICFFLLTPLLVVSTYLCSLGAHQYLQRERWEAVGLVILSLFLLAVYFTWCHVTTRFHMSMWRSWQKTHQQIRLVELQERTYRNTRRQQQRSETERPGRQSRMNINNSPFVLHNNNYVGIPGPSDSRPLFSQSHRPANHDYIALDEEQFSRRDISRVLMV